MSAAIDYSRVRDFIARLPIKDPEKRIVPFRLRPGQQRFLDLLEDRQKRRHPPWVIVCKSRRVGISRICIGIQVAHCIAVPNAEARITAHVKETATDLFEAAALMQRKLRSEQLIVAPEPTRQTVQFGTRASDSQITAGTAKTAAGGRGMGFSSLLATEAAYYEQEESFLSLMNAGGVKPNPLFPIFIESTANGREDVGKPFFDQWMLASKGQSDFGTFFLGPYEDPDCVIDDEERAREIMSRPSDGDNLKEEKDLKRRFKLNLGQLAWRRFILGSKCQGELRKLHQEYPYWPEQAFVSTGSPCFTEKEIEVARKSVERAPEPVTCMLERRGSEIVFSDRKGPFVIFKPPVHGHMYYCGADAARGEEHGDFSAAVMWDGNTGETVATFAERASVDQFADLLDRFGRFYNDGRNPAMMTIEISCNLGNTVQRRMRDEYYYPNFYRWRSKDDRYSPGVSKRAALGWETNARTREMMMADFRIGLQQFGIKVYDKDLLTQMELATIKLGSRWDVEFAHDDLIVAAMIGWEARIQWPPAEVGFDRSVKTTQEAQLDVPAKDSYETFLNISPLLHAHQNKVMKKKNARDWSDQERDFRI